LAPRQENVRPGSGGNRRGEKSPNVSTGKAGGLVNPAENWITLKKNSTNGVPPKEEA